MLEAMFIALQAKYTAVIENMVYFSKFSGRKTPSFLWNITESDENLWLQHKRRTQRVFNSKIKKIELLVKNLPFIDNVSNVIIMVLMPAAINSSK